AEGSSEDWYEKVCYGDEIGHCSAKTKYDHGDLEKISECVWALTIMLIEIIDRMPRTMRRRIEMGIPVDMMEPEAKSPPSGRGFQPLLVFLGEGGVDDDGVAIRRKELLECS
ncbi:hypothetical protein FOZ62_017476, partial [Perkinsus olseni]